MLFCVKRERERERIYTVYFPFSFFFFFWNFLLASLELCMHVIQIFGGVV